MGRIVLIVLMLIVAGLAAAAIVWPTPPAPQHPWLDAQDQRFDVIAHRGASAYRPENTLCAFDAARSLGADVLEADARVTSDGAVVLVHDATFERTAEREDAVADLTFAEVETLPGDAFAPPAPNDACPAPDDTVPTLAQALARHPDARWIIEIKPNTTRAAEAICAVIDASAAPERVMVGSFHDDALTTFRNACPGVATSMASGEVRNFVLAARVGLSRFVRTPAVAMQIPETADGLRVAHPRVIAAAKARGLKVHVWTINDPADMARLYAMDVDAIITDRPDTAVAERALAHDNMAGCALDAGRAAGAGGSDCAAAWIDANLTPLMLQYVGTADSAKDAMSEAELEVLRDIAPGEALRIEYAHAPLTEQLDAGVRHLEFDLFNDPLGGRFLDPMLLREARVREAALEIEDSLIARLQSESIVTTLLAEVPPEPAPDLPFPEALAEPGLKVLHDADIDYRSTCPTFRACLGEVAAWSEANPGHVPIVIALDLRTDGIVFPGATAVLPFDLAAVRQVDADIRATFAPERLITPDDVRQGGAEFEWGWTLDGLAWPTLAHARGKVLFAMLQGPQVTTGYRRANGGLEGAAAFIAAWPGDRAAGFWTADDPEGEADALSQAASAGLLTRTRADEGTLWPRIGETGRRDAALSGAAHLIATNFPEPDEAIGDYAVAPFANGMRVRCHPVHAAGRCGDTPLE